MSAVGRGMVRCDLCGEKVHDSKAVPLRAELLQHVCHHCLLSGWIDYCSGCFQVFETKDLVNGLRCKECSNNP